MSDSLRPHESQHARLPCPSPTPIINSYHHQLSSSYHQLSSSSWWCHPTIESSVVPFSSCLQSFPACGSFPMSQFFTSGGQSTGVSASASVLLRKSEVKSLSYVRLFLTTWTVAHQAPLSMGFSRQEYWSGLPFLFSRRSSWPRDQTWISCIVHRGFTIWATREVLMNIQN